MKRSAPALILLSMLTTTAAGCGRGESPTASGGRCPFGFDRLGGGRATSAAAATPTTRPHAVVGTPPAAVAAAPATRPAARREPGPQLRVVVLDLARRGEVDGLREYFDAGYAADVANDRGDTPLILAAYHGHEPAVRLILSRPDVRVDRVNRMGFTALAGASFKGDVPVLRALVEHGADVNAAGGSGQTPLMFAALAGKEQAVDLLLAHGADPAARARDGNTAASLAEGQGNTVLAERLADRVAPAASRADRF